MESEEGVVEEETYLGSGGRHSIPGVTYQLKLLMLFIVRAMNLGYNTFNLGTEMADAGKLDDLILSFPKNKLEPNGGRYYRFLQSKYSASDKKKVRAADLLNETDGDFSLQKYFQSYLEIMKSQKFLKECDEVKDLILCTTMSFKFKDSCGNFSLIEDIFEPVKNEKGEFEVDDILSTQFVRFKEVFQGKDEVILTLKNSLTSLPKMFAECILDEKEYIHEERENTKDRIYQLYENALLNEVIDVGYRRFSSDFVNSVNLSPPAKHFHDALKSEYLKRRVKCESLQEDTFWNMMKEKNLQITDLRSMIKRPEKVSKKLTDLVRRNMDTKVIHVRDDKSVIAGNIKFLTNAVLHERDGAFYVRKCFLSNEELPGNLNEFRTHLKKQLEYFKIDFSDLEHFRFEIFTHSQSPCLQNTMSSIEEEIETFLMKLVFAVDQANEDTMEEIIMEEVKKRFNEVDAKYVYRSLQDYTLNWMKEKKVRYLSYEDVKEFFDGLKKEISRSIFFDLKDPVHNFTGRERELELLKRNFEKSENKCCRAVICQSAAISGLGGIGKSELARKYAKMHRSDYNNVVWIDCESSASMESSFHRLAFDRLGILKKNVNGDDKKMESVIDEVYLYFCGKTNLFIFDNANHLRSSKEKDDGILKYLPKSTEMKEFHILITSRNQSWGNLKVLDLDNLTETESLEFLRNSIGHIRGYDEGEAAVLASKLSHFPLALQQAASFIRARNKVLMIVGESFSVGDYLRLFEQACLDLLDYEFPTDCSDSYSKTTWTTWHITLKQITSLKYGDTAIKVLYLISYLSPDSIDVKWVSVALCGTSKSELCSAIDLLQQYSMISTQEGEMNIHRLVQLVTRCKLKENGKEMDVLTVILDSALSLDVKHSISAWDHASGYEELVCQFDEVPYHIMKVLVDNFQYNLAVSFGKCCISTLEKYFENVHKNLLNIKVVLGEALCREGKFEESLNLLEKVFGIQKELFGDSDPKTYSTKARIAWVLMELGRFNECLRISNEILKMQQSFVNKNSIDLLLAMHNIASVLGRLGFHKDSLKIYKEICKSECLHKDHQVLLATKLSMAIVLRDMGKHDEAENILVEIYDRFKATKKYGDPHLMMTMLNMALLLRDQRKYNEAFQEIEQVFQMHRDVLGDMHPDTLKIKCYVASLLFHIGRGEEVIKMLKVACDNLKSTVGYDHEYTIFSKFSLAIKYRLIGKPKESLKILEEVYAIRKKVHGEEHVDTLDAKNEIGVNLFLLGMKKKSLVMFESVHRKYIDFFGEEKIKSLKIKHNIAMVLYTQKKYELSLKIFIEVYENLKYLLGENDTATLASLKYINFILTKEYDMKSVFFWHSDK